MKTGNTEKIIRTSYLLELGKDFQESDLVTIASNEISILRSLSREFLQYQISKLIIGKITWSGHYDEETQTVKVIAEKEMFI